MRKTTQYPALTQRLFDQRIAIGVRRFRGFVADIVNRASYASPIRTPRGRDILAACGQLTSESVKNARVKSARKELFSLNISVMRPDLSVLIFK